MHAAATKQSASCACSLAVHGVVVSVRECVYLALTRTWNALHEVNVPKEHPAALERMRNPVEDG